jgi:hypothetical protein
VKPSSIIWKVSCMVWSKLSVGASDNAIRLVEIIQHCCLLRTWRERKWVSG